MRFEGRLLKLGTVDVCQRKFSKDCEISFPNKVPITINFSRDPDKVIGYGHIIKDNKGFKVSVEEFREDFNDPEYNVGGFYINVKSHDESGILVIDECKLESASIVFDPTDKDLVIRRIDK